MKKVLPGEHTCLVIDLSHHNGTVDFKKLKDAGIKMCILKASEAASMRDNYLSKHLAGAQAVNMPCAVYHYFRSNINFDTQVSNFMGAIRPYKEQISNRVVIDWEEAESNNVTEKLRFTLFCQALIDNGFKLMLYGGSSFLNEMNIDKTSWIFSQFHDSAWIAHYTTGPAPNTPEPWTTWKMWQYTETDKLSNYPDRQFDLSLFNGSEEDLHEFFGFNQIAKPEPQPPLIVVPPPMKQIKTSLLTRLINWFKSLTKR